MASGSVNTISLQQFPTLCHLGVVGNLTDSQLLELFLAGNKQTAQASFSALIDRHGPMVLRVCRQILGNPDDAQDAFQATFLVLVRQAGSVRKRDSLACWLYGITQRVARRARVEAAKRRSHERRWAAMATTCPANPANEPECWTELHEELGRLPEKYRESVVLCYLEGLSTEAAARRLGCPQGTILSRLSRAREQLRKRLTRRGVAVPAGLMTAGLVTTTADAAVPIALARGIVEAAVAAVMQGTTSTGAISAAVTQLTQGVLRAMFFTKLKLAAAAIVTIAALATGAGVAIQNLSEPGPEAIVAARGPSSAAQPPKDLKKYPALRDSTVVPKDLTWSEVPPAEWVQVLHMLATRAKTNFEKVKTWKGSYRLLQRDLLDRKFLAHFPLAPKKVEPLIQEFDFKVNFALDTASGSIYRERESRNLRYLRPGTDEPAIGPPMGPDIRSIVTADQSLEFDPEGSLYRDQLPGHPETFNRHFAVRRPYQEGQCRGWHRPARVLPPLAVERGRVSCPRAERAIGREAIQANCTRLDTQPGRRTGRSLVLGADCDSTVLVA